MWSGSIGTGGIGLFVVREYVARGVMLCMVTEYGDRWDSVIRVFIGDYSKLKWEHKALFIAKIVEVNEKMMSISNLNKL